MRRVTLAVIAVVSLSAFALSQAPAPSAAAGRLLDLPQGKHPACTAVLQLRPRPPQGHLPGLPPGRVRATPTTSSTTMPASPPWSRPRTAAAATSGRRPRWAPPTTPRRELILESQDAYLAHRAGRRAVAILGCRLPRRQGEAGPRLAQPAQGELAQLRHRPDQPRRLKGSLGYAIRGTPSPRPRPASPRRAASATGPDHPQKEIYDESKHGNTYYTHVEAMNLKADRWVVGETTRRRPPAPATWPRPRGPRPPLTWAGGFTGRCARRLHGPGQCRAAPRWP